jgi:hypothetical protein
MARLSHVARSLPSLARLSLVARSLFSLAVPIGRHNTMLKLLAIVGGGGGTHAPSTATRPSGSM